MRDDEVIVTLNDLISTCRDGEYGFGACAEYVRSGDVRAVLARRASECAHGALELEQLAVRFGAAAPASSESIVAGTETTHRGWVSTRGTLGRLTDLAMLQECEHGEENAMQRYRHALRKELPVDVRLRVERQLRGARSNHDHIRSLRDRLFVVS